MALPDNQGLDDALRCTELCTIEGVTYVAIPAGVTLPAQPAELTVTTPTLTDALKAQIRAASVHAALISERMIQKIRAVYTPDDEMYFARISIGALTARYAMEAGETTAVSDYGVFVEGVRQWGRDERAKLGL